MVAALLATGAVLGVTLTTGQTAPEYCGYPVDSATVQEFRAWLVESKAVHAELVAGGWTVPTASNVDPCDTLDAWLP